MAEARSDSAPIDGANVKSRSRSSSALRMLWGSRNHSPSPPPDEEKCKSLDSKEKFKQELQPLTDLERKHYEFTQGNYLGKILLDFERDTLAVMEKSGLKEMSCNVTDLCEGFYKHMQMEREQNKMQLKKVAAELEKNMLSREINSHLLNQEFKPPEYFSPSPVMLTPGQRAECMRVFPTRSPKFSGNGAHSANVIEFLGNMELAQTVCKLSEKEFTGMLLTCTTGQAHSMLIDWIRQESSVATLFQNLLLFYDKRITPEEARMQMQTYRAGRQSKLSKVEGDILTLASRAGSSLPPGPAQAENFNHEAIWALIRSLPIKSANITQNTYNIMSAKLGRACTFQELTSALNLYRQQIERDIKDNGDKEGAVRQAHDHPTMYNVTLPVETGSMMQGYSQSNEHEYHDDEHESVHEHEYNEYHNNDEYNEYEHDENEDTDGNESIQDEGDNEDEGENCILCGNDDHTHEQGCVNMVSDNGRIIWVEPSWRTCNHCPYYVMPRLFHHPRICPFRRDGPFFFNPDYSN